jgi:hypothetical protein
MASRASGTPRIKIKNLPKIEPAVYSTVALNDLVVFSANYLQERGIAITVEEMVSICFRLFPQSFSLQNYPRWPDSALVIRRLNDCREKGLLKGSSLDGFELKFKGQKLAERTAKALGLVKPASVKKKAAASRVKPKKIKVVPKAKKLPAAKPVTSSLKGKKSVAPKKQIKKTPVTVKKTVVKSKPIQAKQKATPKPVPAKPVIKKPVVKKHVVTSSSKGKKIAAPKQKSRPQKTQPVQMKMVLPTKEVPPAVPPAKQVVIKRKSSPAPQLTKLQAIQPEIVIPAKEAKSSAPELFVSKEERGKAEKIVRAMERSDAFKIYSKNGHNAKLSEFDFRNMLFATMESTPETLSRNVNLFKGSASIHNRQDLIKFLDFCEVNFASLLKPTAKKAVKKK